MAYDNKKDKSVCSLPGEMTEAILSEQPDAPGQIVLEAAEAVCNSGLDPACLPDVADATFGNLSGPERWHRIALALEKINYPGQQD